MSLTQGPRDFASPPHDGFAFLTVAWLLGRLSTGGGSAFNPYRAVAHLHTSISWAERPYDRRVQLRRGLIAFVFFLVTVTAITAISAPREDEDSPSAVPETTQRSPLAAVTVSFRHPVVAAPPQRPVRAGTHVVVRVEAGVAGNVEIPGLGLIQPVAPGTPALLDVLASRPGLYPVELLPAGGEGAERIRLGTLEVNE